MQIKIVKACEDCPWAALIEDQAVAEAESIQKLLKKLKEMGFVL